MKKTRKEWSALISSEQKGKGKNTYWEAHCPICHFSKAVDVLGSLDSAKTIAELRVSSHIATEHPDMVEDEPSN